MCALFIICPHIFLCVSTSVCDTTGAAAGLEPRVELHLCTIDRMQTWISFYVAASVLSGDHNHLRTILNSISPRVAYVVGAPFETSVRAAAMEVNLSVPSVFVVEDCCWYVFLVVGQLAFYAVM